MPYKVYQNRFNHPNSNISLTGTVLAFQSKASYHTFGWLNTSSRDFGVLVFWEFIPETCCLIRFRQQVTETPDTCHQRWFRQQVTETPDTCHQRRFRQQVTETPERSN